MIVLGIDPGPAESAWVLWDGQRVREHGKDRNEHLDNAFFRAHMADVVAVEMIQSFGMAVGAEVFETCVWVGRLMERAERAAIPGVRRVFRMAVKMHLCHSSRAKDKNIRQALIDRVGAPGSKKLPGPTFGLSGDRWAALAVAVTAMDAGRAGTPGKLEEETGR